MQVVQLVLHLLTACHRSSPVDTDGRCYRNNPITSANEAHPRCYFFYPYSQKQLRIWLPCRYPKEVLALRYVAEGVGVIRYTYRICCSSATVLLILPTNASALQALFLESCRFELFYGVANLHLKLIASTSIGQHNMYRPEAPWFPAHRTP